MAFNSFCNIKNHDYLTPAEWQYHNDLEVSAAEEQQELAERLALEASRLIDQTQNAVVKNKLEIDHQTKVKVKDIEYKCSEIEKQRNDLGEEMELLSGYQKRIENANKSLVGDALEVIAECLKHR